VNRQQAGLKALDAVIDMPIYLAALIILATVSFWTAVAVRWHDRKHPTYQGENTEQ
jgi:uncharacterized membrane protein YhaH (DUF805 family)